jgi:glycerophosphoryl diester phosphodiesterase
LKTPLKFNLVFIKNANPSIQPITALRLSFSFGIMIIHRLTKSSKISRYAHFYVLICLMLIVGGCASQQPVKPITKSKTGPILLAHRGISQTYDPAGVNSTTCTASRIHPPTHALLENTLDSMSVAIKAGADVIEIDVHPTTDGEFAVFHDWTLECRTNSSGRTRDHSMSDLKRFDIGYGYTADGGKTFPFRGKAVGLMPSLSEVLKTFPTQRFLIHVKSNDEEEGELLATYLNSLPKERRQLIAVYGGAKPVAVIRERTGDIMTMSRSTLKICLINYTMIGWSGAIPESCERTLIAIPLNYTRWIWGWPNRFVQQMHSVGSAVFVLGNYSGEASQGIDSLVDLDSLPTGYEGGIWTNEVELIGTALRDRRNGRH